MDRAQGKKILDAMRVELDRSIKRLKVPGHPKPYFISYLARDIRAFSVMARYGSLVQKKADHRRPCYVDVRVGNYQYDHVVKGGLTDNSDEAESFDLIDLPVETGEDSLRFSLWRLTDSRYREAVRAFHERKSRDVSYLDENRQFPSFEKQKPAKTILSLQDFNIDAEAVEHLVREASKVFKEHEEIKNSYIEFNAEWHTKFFISSEGVERVWQEPLIHMTAYMWFHNKQSNLESSLVFHTKDPSEIPTLDVLKQKLKARVQQLKEIAKGERMTSYAGPVLMAPGPAGLFIHEVLGHRLEGCRLLSDDEGRTLKDKLGKRITHRDLTIYDDPTMEKMQGQTLVGSYPFDDEGTPAERVDLIEGGVLKSFLTTRSPLKKTAHKNNGHARNQTFERPMSRMGNLVVESASQNTFADMRQLLLDEIKKRKLPYGIILYEVEGGETGTEAYNFQAFKGDITACAKLLPNGREVFVRGVDFVGTPMSSLANILAVGNDYLVDNSFCVAESGSIPVSTVSPSILLSNLELQAKDPSTLAQYALPLPWHDKA